MEEIYIKTDNIKLDSFLKLAGEASTGGEAKKIDFKWICKNCRRSVL